MALNVGNQIHAFQMSRCGFDMFLTNMDPPAIIQRTQPTNIHIPTHTQILIDSLTKIQIRTEFWQVLVEAEQNPSILSVESKMNPHRIQAGT